MTGPTNESTWTGSELLADLAGPPAPSVAAVFGHVDHTALETPHGDAVARRRRWPRRLPDGARLVFSMGCHSGLAVSDATVGGGAAADDLAAAITARGAVYVASHRLRIRRPGQRRPAGAADDAVRRRARRRRVASGDALRNAKQDYFASQGLYGAYDEKALSSTILYGLPMFAVGNERPVRPTPPNVTTDADRRTPGLSSAPTTRTSRSSAATRRHRSLVRGRRRHRPAAAADHRQPPGAAPRRARRHRRRGRRLAAARPRRGRHRAAHRADRRRLRRRVQPPDARQRGRRARSRQLRRRLPDPAGGRHHRQRHPGPRRSRRRRPTTEARADPRAVPRRRGATPGRGTQVAVSIRCRATSTTRPRRTGRRPRSARSCCERTPGETSADVSVEAGDDVRHPPRRRAVPGRRRLADDSTSRRSGGTFQRDARPFPPRSPTSRSGSSSRSSTVPATWRRLRTRARASRRSRRRRRPDDHPHARRARRRAGSRPRRRSVAVGAATRCRSMAPAVHRPFVPIDGRRHVASRTAGPVRAHRAAASPTRVARTSRWRNTPSRRRSRAATRRPTSPMPPRSTGDQEGAVVLRTARPPGTARPDGLTLR